jgi:enoyl-CoA hydratase/carnithine racemase
MMSHFSNSSDGLSVEMLAPHVLQLRLDRPERLNALGVDMVPALHHAIRDAAGSDIRVLVLTGTGRAFCAGADLKARLGMSDSERWSHNRAISAAADALAAVAVPTLAAINGIALGGGCELALACDIRIAAAGAQIGLTESRIGAIPGAGGTQRLPRLIGQSRALEMMFTGEPVSAERAEQIGLVNKVVAAEILDQEALRLANLIAEKSPSAARTLKALVYTSGQAPPTEGMRMEAEAVKRVFASSDYGEGLAAFAEKRPPRFGATGRSALHEIEETTEKAKP